MYNEYPGDGAYYVLCDICGRKLRRRDALKTYGTRGKLIVCKQDYEDPHPQDRPALPRSPGKIMDFRSEGSDKYHFIDTVGEIETGSLSLPNGVVPGAPTDLVAQPTTSRSITLTWQMDKTNIGSGVPTGYKIERETPVGGGFSTIVSNTGFPSLYYLDETVSASTQYNYRVSTVTDYGTSSASTAANATTPAS